MDMFSALADPTRRNILEMLASRGKLSATDISDKFRVSPPAISQHLKVLREARLVDMEKRAQQRMYQINTKTIHGFASWVHKLEKTWNERLDVLGEVLKEVQTRKEVRLKR